MDPDKIIFDILNNGNKVSEVEDYNPITIDSESECCEILTRIKDELYLTDSELELLQNCQNVLSAKTDDDITFSISDLLDLEILAQNHPTHSNEILACSQFIMECVEFCGEIPNDFYLRAAEAHGVLGDMLCNAMKGENNDDNDDDDE